VEAQAYVANSSEPLEIYERRSRNDEAYKMDKKMNAETFEASGKGKSILEIFSDNNAVLTAYQDGIEEFERVHGHREAESFMMEFSPDMKSCELVHVWDMVGDKRFLMEDKYLLCGVIDFKRKDIWSWVQSTRLYTEWFGDGGEYHNGIEGVIYKGIKSGAYKEEKDAPIFKTMLKTYVKKLEEIGFKNPRMTYYQEYGEFEMKYDSYAPVYCTSHDWGEAYVKDLSEDGVTFQQECSFCGITRRGYSDVKLDWDMKAENFEASVIHRGKQPKGAVAKTMMNHAMMERAEIESVIQELENKVQLGIISEEDLMKSLTQRFGADFEVIDWNNLHDTNRELFVQKTQEYYNDFKENNPKLHEDFEENVMNEESWYGYERGKSYAETKEKWTKKLSDLGYEYERIDDYWEYIGYENTSHYVPCNNCEGEGIIITKYYPATREDPADADYVDCEMCEGKGKVLEEMNAETFEARGGKRMYCPNCKTNRTWSSGFKKEKMESGENPYDFVFYFCQKCDYAYDPKTSKKMEDNWREMFGYDAETKKGKLSKTSCCCGATKSNPCLCMIQGEMNCSAKAPMCPCYAEIEMGTDVEMEHTKSRKEARKIAMEHLAEHPDYYSRLKKAGLNAENEGSCFRCGCKNDLVYCELCEDSWCNDECREPSCWDKHYDYTCTRNAAETFNAEEGDDCPNCYCEHQNLSLDGTPSVDEEYVSVNVVCDDCGMKGYTTTYPYEWDNEAKLEDVGLPLAVSMYNPNYGELRCSRCRERFEKSAENYVLDVE